MGIIMYGLAVIGLIIRWFLISSVIITTGIIISSFIDGE